MSPLAAGYAAAWQGREPASDDESYLAGWRDGLEDRRKAERFPRLDAGASSKAAGGRARFRADNSFVFHVREDRGRSVG